MGAFAAGVGTVGAFAAGVGTVGTVGTVGAFAAAVGPFAGAFAGALAAEALAAAKPATARSPIFFTLSPIICSVEAISFVKSGSLIPICLISLNLSIGLLLDFTASITFCALTGTIPNPS